MKILALTLLATLAVGAPHAANDASREARSLGKRATVCGADNTIHTASFDVHNAFVGTLGSQCLTVSIQAADGSGGISWSTAWSWDGDATSRKSFVAAQLRKPRYVPVSSIASIPTTLTWR